MFQKGEKYFADWRDSSGVRHRKSFHTSREAHLYEAAQRAKPKTAHAPKRPPRARIVTTRATKATSPKSKGAQGNSARSCAPSLKRAYPATAQGQPKPSQKSSATKVRRNSPRPM